MSYPAFHWKGQANLAVSTASANVALAAPYPASTTALITNIGAAPAFVVLGSDEAVAATIQTGIAIAPNRSLPLAIGDATYLAAICVDGTAQLSISTGV